MLSLLSVKFYAEFATSKKHLVIVGTQLTVEDNMKKTVVDVIFAKKIIE